IGTVDTASHTLSLHAALPIYLPQPWLRAYWQNLGCAHARRRTHPSSFAVSPITQSHRTASPIQRCLGWYEYQNLLQAHPVSAGRSEAHTSELQPRENLVCRLL